MLSSESTLIVRGLSEGLRDCQAPNAEAQALLGFAIGAAYSLSRALVLGYADQPAIVAGSVYLRELKGVADGVASGNAPIEGPWLATYYFNSALFRLAALGERIGKYATGIKWDVAPSIRRDANHMKHDVDVLLACGREANVEMLYRH